MEFLGWWNRITIGYKTPSVEELKAFGSAEEYSSATNAAKRQVLQDLKGQYLHRWSGPNWTEGVDPQAALPDRLMVAINEELKGCSSDPEYGYSVGGMSVVKGKPVGVRCYLVGREWVNSYSLSLQRHVIGGKEHTPSSPYRVGQFAAELTIEWDCDPADHSGSIG